MDGNDTAKGPLKARFKANSLESRSGPAAVVTVRIYETPAAGQSALSRNFGGQWLGRLGLALTFRGTQPDLLPNSFALVAAFYFPVVGASEGHPRHGLVNG